MEIHKPKPVRNWREFLKEYAIIVLGVATALAGEQTVEWLHWRTKVADAREVVTAEMTGNIQGAVIRLRIQNCTERRLDELAKILDEAASKGQLPPVGDIGLPARRAWSSGAWESLVASQAATHFPTDQVTRLAVAYHFVDRVQFNATAEMEAWSHLGTMVGPGRKLDPASEADLRQALGDARAYGRAAISSLVQLLAMLKPIDLSFSQRELDAISVFRRQPLSDFRICQPIGAVPGHYGQTTYPFAPNAEEQGLSLLPDNKARQP
jgi:hypothetical protein